MRAYLERQRAFTEKFFRERGVSLDDLRRDPAEQVRWMKDYVLHLEAELHEFLGEFNWKMHRAPEGRLVRSNALEEWVDALKYHLGLALIMGFTPEEIWTEFDRKSAVVELRFQQEKMLAALSSEDKVVAVDLDGVLVEYPTCFIDWIRRGSPGGYVDDVTGRHLPLEEVHTSQQLRRLLGLPLYEKLKDTYRQCGEKARLPVRPGARQLLAGLRGAGVKIVILSARPYKRYGRIFADTMQFLESNGLPYDAILFDEDKHLQIVRRFPALRLLIEDTPAQANAVAALGYRVLVPETPDNAGADLLSPAERFPDLQALRDRALDLLRGTP